MFMPQRGLALVPTQLVLQGSVNEPQLELGQDMCLGSVSCVARTKLQEPIQKGPLLLQGVAPASLSPDLKTSREINPVFTPKR